MAKKAISRGKNLPAKRVESIRDADYMKFLSELKKNINSAQIKAIISVNRDLIKLYWEIGSKIHSKQKSEGWGAKTLENLAKDLKSGFPSMQGFSLRNLKYMVHFAKEYPDFAIRQQLVAQIPWGHNILLIQKIKDVDERLWYASKAIEHGWSRSMLTIWIENDLYSRKGKAVTNFKITLSAPQSDLAQQSLKDPYVFDFLTLHEEHLEKELEEGLLNHVQKFLIELGQGFAFVGRQYSIKAGDQDLHIDLLFYHLKLRCYVILEIKGRKFDSRDAGQISAYLSAVDDQLRHKDDQPTIGIILCKTKNDVYAEYVLRNFNRPIGVAEFETKLVEKLPKDLKTSLPSVEEIEAELSSIELASPKQKKGKKSAEQIVQQAVGQIKKLQERSRIASSRR